jgi:hypothetical protein
MKDPKVTIRYIGFQALSDGSRRFDFSFGRPDSSLQLISVEARQEQRARRRTSKEAPPDASAHVPVVFGWCCCLAANDEQVEVVPLSNASWLSKHGTAVDNIHV